MDTENMRLLVICGELPYPARYGGAADVWTRLQAFRDIGIRLFLLTWRSPVESKWPTSSSVAVVREVVDELAFLTFKTGPNAWLRRAVELVRRPWAVSARMSFEEDEVALGARVTHFRPDAIWVDRFTAFPLAQRYATALGVPLLYRSHNVEHQYQRAMTRTSIGFKAKVVSALSCIHLKKYENYCIRHSNVVFDISRDDIEFWRKKGYNNLQWLPTLNPARPSPSFERKISHDVVYLGSLHHGPNLHGIFWFLKEVLPILRLQRPNISVLIGGSSPADALKTLARASDVELRADVEDPDEIWGSGRVLINPIFLGGGVNVKTQQMLLYDRPLVVTPFALRGLPEQVVAEFFQADSPSDFAELIDKGITMPSETKISRSQARAMFEGDSLLKAISQAQILQLGLGRLGDHHNICNLG